jgi:hypothetical protein
MKYGPATCARMMSDRADSATIGPRTLPCRTWRYGTKLTDSIET